MNAVSHALTSPAGTTKPVLATIVSVRFRASSLDDNTSPFPSQIASNSFRSCSTCSVSHLRTCSAIAIAFLLGARSLRIVSSCGDGGAFSSTSPAPSFCSGGLGLLGGVERVRRGGVNRCIIIREDSKRLRRRSYYRLVSHPAKSKDVWLDL